MLRKYVSIIFLVLILFVATTASTAIASSNVSSTLELKIESMEKLEKDGINKMVDEKIAEYYKNNEIIDESKLVDLESSEAKEALNEIENEMLKFNSRLNNPKDSSTIGTNSFGDDEPSGTNDISFSAFENADIILVHDGACAYGYWRHGGTYDERSGKFVSAQIADQGNGKGVIFEDKYWYRNNYDEAAGYWVPDNDNEIREETRDLIMNYLCAQIGEPYSFSPYFIDSSWYCTKLPWVGWKEFYSIDINDDGGLCLPDDIEDSSETSRFAYSD